MGVIVADIASAVFSVLPVPVGAGHSRLRYSAVGVTVADWVGKRGLTADESSPRTIAAFLLCVLGFALTLYVFYPGVMNYDSRYVHSYIGQNPLGDWQSPLMTLLWAAIDPIAPGPGSMFLLIVSLYWLAFALLALTVARRSWVALAIPLLALSPPAFFLVGMIWRDVLFAAVWLLAATLVFAAGDRHPTLRYWIQTAALVLLAFGVLLRPNAVPAAPILAAYILWPLRWQLKRAALMYAPARVAFVVLVPLIYYGIIGAKREHPLYQIIVFDLGGITHFTKQNQFPLSWTSDEAALLSEHCYEPSDWGVFWNYGPCQFVMRRLVDEKRFGTSALADDWRRAVIKHPIAYLQHRAAFMQTFLFDMNTVMWTLDIENPPRKVFADRPAFTALRELHQILQSTWLFKPAVWLLLCIGLCALGWRQRNTSEGAFVLGICGSAAIYVATYFLVGVASDFRYSYWAILAALSGSAVLLPRYLARMKCFVSGRM
jgi:hypothetical protein